MCYRLQTTGAAAPPQEVVRTPKSSATIYARQERALLESFRWIPGSAILLSAGSRLNRVLSSSLTFLICKMGYVITLHLQLG